MFVDRTESKARQNAQAKAFFLFGLVRICNFGDLISSPLTVASPVYHIIGIMWWKGIDNEKEQIFANSSADHRIGNMLYVLYHANGAK